MPLTIRVLTIIVNLHVLSRYSVRSLLMLGFAFSFILLVIHFCLAEIIDRCHAHFLLILWSWEKLSFIEWVEQEDFSPFRKLRNSSYLHLQAQTESKHEPDQFESMSKSWFLWPRISGCFNCFLFFVTQGHAHLVPDTKLGRESQLNQQIVGLQAKLQIAWLEKHFWES